jgi:replicative superfamily II helicase
MRNGLTKKFPLFTKASSAGIIKSGNAVIVAPTATGKSYIGRSILRFAITNKEPGVHVYLVPYRALASEIYESFCRELNDLGIELRIRIATGDYTDPIHPGDTDILIATYERFAALLRMPDLNIGRVIADEAHLIADQTRGVVVEGLLARMKFCKHPKSLCALSAIITNPQELGDWLGIPVIIGDSSDRTVEVELCCEIADDLATKLIDVLLPVFRREEQAIIFCRSKVASQSVARQLKPVVSEMLTKENLEALRKLATEMAEDAEEVEDLLELLSSGVSYHHAGLSRESRKAVEAAFRQRHLKAIACTPTLAAGVNLPAGLVIVRDVFRTEFIRGFPQQVLLSTGELLNMLGRAGRPGQVEHGRGIALIEVGYLDEHTLADLQTAIQNGRGDRVTSRLPESFNSLMRFLLAVTADRGETTLTDLAEGIRRTLWYHEQPQEISFDRPFREDIMEDVPSFARVTPDMRVKRAWPVTDGVAGTIMSGANIYNFAIRFTGMECTCPARAKWQRQNVCKHIACAIHHLLFSPRVDSEVRSRTIYATAHLFRRSLDLGTKIREAVNLLQAWGLLEAVPGGFRASPVGVLAANSSLDLLLIRTVQDRIRKVTRMPSPKEVAIWVIEDYFSEENKREKWLRAVEPWLDEVDIKQIKLPERYRGDFERGLENLGQLATLYGEIADSMAKPQIAEVCRLTRGCLQYGVSAELIPLMALRIPQLGRARCRFLYKEKGIKSLEGLANSNPEHLKGSHAPIALTQRWVQIARNMWKVRNHIVRTPEDERDQEIDNFLTSFQADQLSLFGDDGILSGVV